MRFRQQSAKPQISLRICTVWSEPLLVAWILYECKATDWTSFGVCELVWVYTRQNATLCRGSIYDILASSRRCVRYAGYFHISKKRKNSDKYHKSRFHASSAPFMLEFIVIVWFFHANPWKGDTAKCAKSVFVRHFPTACYPSLKTTTTRGLIVGFFDLKPGPWTITLSLCLRLILLAVPGPSPPPPPKRLWQTYLADSWAQIWPDKMFSSRTKGADKAVRCADWSSHVTKSGYIRLQTCGKQSEFRDVPIISWALLILNSQPRHAFLLCFCGQLRRWRFSVGAQARLSLRCSHSWLISWN